MNTNSLKRKNCSTLQAISHKKHKDELQNVLRPHAKSGHLLVDLCKETSMEHFEENDGKIFYDNNHNG